MAPVENQLVVFDFDETMANDNTDTWIFEVLAIDLRRKMHGLAQEMQWTDLIAHFLKELHARRIKREEIEHALRIMPFHPAMVRAVNKLKAAGRTTFLCLSDANTVFISTILEDKKLTHIFDEIVTNPAQWTQNDLLDLRRHIKSTDSQHNCTIGCGVNLCKGQELDDFLTRRGEQFDRIVYLGDGGNDFCPILRLREQDLVLCRSKMGLSSRIKKEGQERGLKPEIKYWHAAWEVEEIFSDL